MGKRGKVDVDDYVVSCRRGGKAAGKGRKNVKNEIETSDIDDDYSSYASNLSYQNNLDRESIGEGSTGESGIEDNDAVDQQLDCSLEGAAVKNTVVRGKNLKIIKEMLCGKILGEVLFKRKMELVEVLEKSLKHGKSAERVSTAHIAVLYVLQVGSEDDLEVFYTNIKPLLLHAITDKSGAGSQRAKVLLYTATLCFLCSENVEDRKEMLAILRDKVGSTESDVIIHALSALSLILTICTPTERRNNITILLPLVRALLSHMRVEVRIEAGELVAHMFELGRDCNVDFDENVEDLKGLMADLETLSTDAAKFRAKRDRKQQRSSFREILDIVGGYGQINEAIKVSVQETLQLDSWSEKVQYSAIKEVLGPSTSLYLQSSLFVREIFGLGPPLLVIERIGKAEKHEMKKVNAAYTKARQRNMAKQRDKRMVL